MGFYLRHITATRVFNLFSLFAGYMVSLILRRPVVWGMPCSISIEPAAHCNLSCPQCPAGMGLIKRDSSMMQPDLFKEIIDQAAPRAMYLMLYFQGEPLMNKHFSYMVRYARSKGLYTMTSTNAQLIDEARARELVSSGLNKLIISMDGATPEVYALYRKKGMLQNVLSGAEHLVRAKEELGKKDPFIEIQFIVFRHNQHQLEDARKLARVLGVDRFRIKSAQIYPGEGAENYLTDIEAYSRYFLDKDGSLKLRRRLLNRCRRIWSTAVLTSDGELVSCCYDKDASWGMGSVRDEDLSVLWKGSRFNDFRSGLLKNRQSREMCRNCTEGLGRKVGGTK